MFLKGSYCRHVNTRVCLGKGKKDKFTESFSTCILFSLYFDSNKGRKLLKITPKRKQNYAVNLLVETQPKKEFVNNWHRFFAYWVKDKVCLYFIACHLYSDSFHSNCFIAFVHKWLRPTVTCYSSIDFLSCPMEICYLLWLLALLTHRFLPPFLRLTPIL